MEDLKRLYEDNFVACVLEWFVETQKSIANERTNPPMTTKCTFYIPT